MQRTLTLIAIIATAASPSLAAPDDGGPNDGKLLFTDGPYLRSMGEIRIDPRGKDPERESDDSPWDTLRVVDDPGVSGDTRFRLQLLKGDELWALMPYRAAYDSSEIALVDFDR